jgi:hypothetical protein
MQRRRHLPALLFVIMPLCLCNTCCALFFLPAYAGVIPHIPLILLGSKAQGTIAGIQPCQSSVLISGSPQGGFSLSSGSSQGVSVTVSFADAQGRTHTGKTVACTQLPPGVQVQDMIDVQYTAGAPQDIILAKDLGVYQGATAVAAIGVAPFCLLVYFFFRFLRGTSAQPLAAAYPGAQLYQPDLANFTETQRRIKEASDRAIAYENYPTRRIGIKEALLLLYIRNTSPGATDDVWQSGKTTLPHAHMIAAAMLMDLVLQRRIEIERSGGIFPRRRVRVVDPSPIGDPDTDAFLASLRGKHARLQSIYDAAASGHPIARLIDQLRKGEYVRLHVPTTGKFSQQREVSQNPLMRAITSFLGEKGFEAGSVVATDDYSRALPWTFLYTSHSAEEEAMFDRVQTAIATHFVADDFTHALLLLIAAIYVSRTLFQGFIAVKGIYRFYPREERKGIVAYLRDLARQERGSLRDIYEIARRIDYRIENPPSA